STTVSVWDIASDNDMPIATLRDLGTVSKVSFARDNERVAFTSNGEVHLLEVSKKKQRKLDLKGLATFVADGETLAVGSTAGLGSGRLWDPEKQEERAKLEVNGPVIALASSPDGRTLAVATNSNQIVLWDYRSGQKKVDWKLPEPAIAS